MRCSDLAVGYSVLEMDGAPSLNYDDIFGAAERAKCGTFLVWPNFACLSSLRSTDAKCGHFATMFWPLQSNYHWPIAFAWALPSAGCGNTISFTQFLDKSTLAKPTNMYSNCASR